MTEIFNKKEYVKKRQHLRKRMTRAEILLWSKLKGKQLLSLKFRRQYGVDFYCTEIKLAIEVDGDVHGYNSRVLYDKQRQKNIEALGISKVWGESLCTASVAVKELSHFWLSLSWIGLSLWDFSSGDCGGLTQVC